MANQLPVSPPPPPEASSRAEGAALERLSSRARWLAVVPLVAIVLFAIGLIAVWVSEDIRMSAFAHALGMRGTSLQPEAVAYPQAIWPNLTRTVPILVFAATMIFLFQLFRRLAAGHVLDARNARLVSRAGLGFVAFAVTAIVSNTVTTLLLSFYNLPGERVLSIGLTASDIGAFAAGFALWGLGSVLGEAARVADDHASIV